MTRDKLEMQRLVKGLRTQMQLTQEDLARELGVSFATVNSWENGKHMPHPFLARQLIQMKDGRDRQPGKKGLSVHK